MDLLQRVDSMIEERHLLNHPFYQAWRAGTLPSEALQEYARQYYAFESTFPRILSALHSRTERADLRASLLDNLWDEEHGAENHAELWLRFAEGLGVERDDVRDAEWSGSTRRLVDGYLRTASDDPVAAGVAAVYAYEAQVPPVAQAKIDGLRERYGIDDERTLAFFTTHAYLDIEHSQAEREMVAELGNGHEEAVLAATRRALDGWWGFLDGVYSGEVAAAH
jgi:pyrroloquinoline-quinone synthase